MAQDQETSRFRAPTAPRRRIFLRRRRSLPFVRLGGKRPRQGQILVRAFRRMRLRWLKMQYLCMMKKLKQSYKMLVKEMAEAASTTEAFQQRLVMEASFAVPVMGASFFTAGPLPHR